MGIYVVYLTIYYGDRLPRRYIGSSKLEKVKNGYHGSVVSKKYKEIWKKELKENPNLFKTRVLSIHETDILARKEELKLHKKYDVVKSDKYINMSFASINGFFGMNTSGINHPNFGRKFSDEYCRKNSESHKGIKQSSETIQKRVLKITGKKRTDEFKQNRTGEKNPMFGKKGNLNPNYGKTYSFEKKTCPHCGVTGGGGNMTRHHFDNCKLKVEVTL